MLSPAGPHMMGNAHLDENLFNTWDSEFGTPRVMVGKGRFVESDVPVEAGPGAFVTHAELERGYNAWFGAPGYYVDSPGVDRVIDDVDPYAHLVGARLGLNPWDEMFGYVGDFGLYDGSPGVGIREWPAQAGEYSLS